MIDTITFDNLPRLVYQQRECDPIFFHKTSELTGPLSSDSERRGGVRFVRLNMLLHCRQLAATVRSPCPSEEGENDMFRVPVSSQRNIFPLMRRERE